MGWKITGDQRPEQGFSEAMVVTKAPSVIEQLTAPNMAAP